MRVFNGGFNNKRKKKKIIFKRWTFKGSIWSMSLVQRFWSLDTLLTLCYYHVTYLFQSESTLCSCLNVKELPAWNKHDIWSLSGSNVIRSHNHLVRERIPNHLAKLASLAKWLSVRSRTKRLLVRIPLLPLRYFINRFLTTISSQ